jgi:SSS family transporter
MPHALLAAGELLMADKVMLVGYFTLMVGIGVYFYRQMRGMKDYFSGGNRIPWWLSGVSFYMSSFSAFTFVAYSELAYKHGFVAVTLYWVTAPAVLLGALFVAGRWRRARITSPVEYLEDRYGLGIRQTFTWINVPVRIIDDGLRLLAIGLIVSGGLGLGLSESIFWSGLIILVYTFMGGLWAVMVTDFVQFIVMMAGIVLLIPLALSRVGGLQGLVENAPEGFFNLTDPAHDWFYLAVFFLLITLLYNSNFALVQRYYCVPTERDARKVGLLVSALNVLGPPLFFLPAMAARQFLPDADSTRIYATICVTLLPTGVLGLIIAAMFSATMSALSSDYNVLASVLTNDVYKRLFAPEASEKRLVLIGRVTTVVIGAIPLGVALLLATSDSETTLFRQMVTLFSVAGAPMAVPMLAGLLWSKATNAGAMSGFLAGVSIGLVLFFLDLGENVIALSTTTATLVVMVAVSLRIPAKGAELERSRRFLKKLATPLSEDTVTPEETAAPSPFRIVGICTALIALLMLSTLFYVKDNQAFKVDLVMGLALLIAGSLMVIKAKPAQHSQEETS